METIGTHYKTESLHFWGLMNSATKLPRAPNYPQTYPKIRTINGCMQGLGVLGRPQKPKTEVLNPIP